jgi:hypothetical protein
LPDLGVVVPVVAILFVVLFHALLLGRVVRTRRQRKTMERTRRDERRQRAERKQAITMFEPGEAVVDRREEIGPPIADHAEIVLALRVQRGGAGEGTSGGSDPPFAASMHLFTPVGLLPKLAPGTTIPVRYNPAEPTDLVLDWWALGLEAPFVEDREDLRLIAETRRLVAET